MKNNWHDDVYPIMLTGHNWINVKDMRNKPLAKLVDTNSITLNEQYKHRSLKLPKNSLWQKEYDYNYLNDLAFGAINSVEWAKKYDYVVPSHFVDFPGFMEIHFDCFKKLNWYERLTYWWYGVINYDMERRSDRLFKRR